MENLVKRKMVVIGDGACGKTSLLYVFQNERFPETYVPTIFENYSMDVPLPNQSPSRKKNKPPKMGTLGLWDTAGQEDYDSLRPLSYNDVDVAVICYSIDEPNTLANVAYKWVCEARQYMGQEIPILLVGNKIDLRSSEEKMELLTTQDGLNMAKEQNIQYFIECSAKELNNVQNLLDTIVQIAFRDYRKRKVCSIL